MTFKEWSKLIICYFLNIFKHFLHFTFLHFFKFIYLERACCRHMSGGGAEREREREREDPKQAPHCPIAGLKPTNCEIMT